MTQKIKHLHSISCSPLTFLLIQKIKPSRLSWRIRWGQWKLENAHQWYLRLLLVFLHNDNSLFLLVKKITQQVQCFWGQVNRTLHCLESYATVTWLGFPLSLFVTAHPCHVNEQRPTNHGLFGFLLVTCSKRLRDQPFSAGQRKASRKGNFSKAADNVEKLIHVAKK